MTDPRDRESDLDEADWLDEAVDRGDESGDREWY